ncbi:hypothetical protein AGABI2DRAFT_191017 [Agaricus bisporus var. bisporus H97]|uniref:hypothetical protein n=1 Tax=Agaricus bisporus var. bisporus (strain H97 / ATCC MYA-4626 / FGSC 10389) TaxID=936046 RepID=UPI00029F5974|nr:hypothetical protein AGABI2DRAFT_191017 [Agaricus bisporus var. bisporus H97]EKV48792.1 hypothetical protein AGABI2DRAFT_191017 [Agaricus bisporus var. bisporus H97]
MDGKIYFYIFNGRKYCVDKGNIIAIEKVEDTTVDAYGTYGAHGALGPDESDDESDESDDSDDTDDSGVPEDPPIPEPNFHAMWQMAQDGDKYTFRNRSTGGYIVLGHKGIKTSSSVGENSKWHIVPAMDLSVDKCRIFKSNSGATGGKLLANKNGQLISTVQKNFGDITQQADQLFRIVYAGDAN